MQKENIEKLQLKNELIDKYGLLIGGPTLARLLGYSGSKALYQAIYRGTCPVPVTRVEGRKGYFAATDDVAGFVIELQTSAAKNFASVHFTH